MFKISDKTIDYATLRETCLAEHSGGFCSFEGWVRNHHGGKSVGSLEYTAYASMAEKEGAKVVAEAIERFAITKAVCVHRVGHLQIGEMAVYVGVSAAHRNAAFESCRFIIDTIKSRVPIWKKEFYIDGSHNWPNCKGCSEHEH